MKLHFPAHIRCILALLLLALALSGCKEKGKAPAPLPFSQVPAAIELAFKGAKPEIKKMTDAALAALKARETEKALFLLQDLSTQTGLTPRQREVAAGSMLAANQEVQSAAANGDKQAAEAVQYRRMSK